LLRAAAAALLFGALCGLFDPRPLYSVEIAQVVSGVVTLPPQAPMAIHDARVFSLVIDAAAVLLRAGVSEEAVCRLFSILMGAVSSLAVAIVAYAITGSRQIALAAPIVFLLGIVTPKTIAAHKYSLVSLVSQSDIAVHGYAAALLALSALVLRPRAGAWLLPVAVAVHVSFGVAAVFIVASGGVFDRAMAASLARHWRAIVLSSLGVGLLWILNRFLGAPAVPDALVDPQYVTAIIKWWDGHRAPLLGPGASFIELAPFFALDAAFIAVACLALVVRPPRLARVRFWIIGQLILTVIVIGAVVADEFTPVWGPLPLHGLMMSRWLNLNIVVLPLLVIVLIMHAVDERRRLLIEHRLVTGGILCAIVLVLAFKLAYRSHLDIWGPHQQFFASVHGRPGAFIMAGHVSQAEMPQLRSRRAPLLDIELLDAVPYAPAMGIGCERILNDIYGVTLLSPQNWATLNQVQPLWEARSSAEWRAVLQPYAVTDIIVPRTWKLRLPLVNESPELALYTITP
jgi:hypothetical protein